MRAIRALAVVALVVVDVSAAAAQSTRGFTDSWFWGVKGGALSYQVMSDLDGSALSPLVGFDWMITRTKGGLYVSVDQSFFDQFIFISDSISPLDTVPRQVDLGSLRRYTIAGMLFPFESRWARPYFGLGATLHHLGKADALGSYRNNQQFNLVQATIAQFRATATPIFILGTQLKLPLASAFIQFTAAPANENFFLYTNSNFRTSIEAGLRYNVGSSIERMQ
ncbi:MAG: hypothetical protein WD801_10480 [Gemmatimonadaceae bacterium]